MSEPLLEVDSIDAFYGDFHALAGVSLRVGAGQVVAVIGANGAGKSTLLRSMSGLMHPRRGAIRFEGANISRMPAFDVVKAGVAMVPEGRRLFPSLSVEENLLIGAQSRRAGPWTLTRVYELFPVLAERRHLPATALSGGQQQMAAIGRALMANPDLLVLDEPSEGLAPVIIDELAAVLRRLSSEGTAILLIEQNLSLVERVVRSYHVLSKGRVVENGSLANTTMADLQRHIAI